MIILGQLEVSWVFGLGLLPCPGVEWYSADLNILCLGQMLYSWSLLFSVSSSNKLALACCHGNKGSTRKHEETPGLWGWICSQHTLSLLAKSGARLSPGRTLKMHTRLRRRKWRTQEGEEMGHFFLPQAPFIPTNSEWELQFLSIPANLCSFLFVTILNRHPI